MPTLETIPIPNPNILSRRIDNEAVLIMPQQGKVKVLNEVGALIWELIDGERNIQQIAEEVCQQFEVEYATAEIDTIKFVTNLIEREIIAATK